MVKIIWNYCINYIIIKYILQYNFNIYKTFILQILPNILTVSDNRKFIIDH